MNKKFSKNYIYLALLIILFFYFISCNEISTNNNDSSDNNSNKKIFIEASGEFNGLGSSGFINKWIMYEDGTMSGEWTEETGIYSLEINGTYTIINNTIDFIANGKAYTQSSESTYTTIGSGFIDMNNKEGIGQYSIDFTDINWPDDEGTWFITF